MNTQKEAAFLLSGRGIVKKGEGHCGGDQELICVEGGFFFCWLKQGLIGNRRPTGGRYSGVEIRNKKGERSCIFARGGGDLIDMDFYRPTLDLGCKEFSLLFLLFSSFIFPNWLQRQCRTSNVMADLCKIVPPRHGDSNSVLHKEQGRGKPRFREVKRANSQKH